MSRGTFNGPGGTHNRWQVPKKGGSGLGPHHLLHFKNQLGVLTPADQITLQRDTLQNEGLAVVRLQSREFSPNGGLVGLTLDFVAVAGGDLAGTCANQGYTDVFYCPNRTGPSYSAYRVEVVDRVGNDSFAPGHGVLITKSRASGTPRVWMIDPNPDDIGMIDFYRPDGTPVPVVRGDPRQLNDAAFNAGTSSGSEYEYKDDFNRLHFYVVAKQRDASCALLYDIGVRHYDGAGPFTRAVALRESDEDATPAWLPRDLHLPADEHGPGWHGRVRLGPLPSRRRVEQRRLEGDAAERARRDQGRPDNAGAGARAAGSAHGRGRRANDSDAQGHVRGRLDQDGDAHVQRARPRHDPGRLGVSSDGARAAAALAPRPSIVALMSCGARVLLLLGLASSSPAAAATTRRRAEPQISPARCPRERRSGTRRRVRFPPRRSPPNCSTARGCAPPTCGGSAHSCSSSRPAGAIAAPSCTARRRAQSTSTAMRSGCSGSSPRTTASPLSVTRRSWTSVIPSPSPPSASG